MRPLWLYVADWQISLPDFCCTLAAMEDAWSLISDLMKIAHVVKVASQPLLGRVDVERAKTVHRKYRVNIFMAVSVSKRIRLIRFETSLPETFFICKISGYVHVQM